jgi:hypothetical protein
MWIRLRFQLINVIQMRIRIRIQHITLMRIRILPFNLLRIRIHNTDCKEELSVIPVAVLQRGAPPPPPQIPLLLYAVFLTILKLFIFLIAKYLYR